MTNSIRISLLQGEPDAIAAIRRATREAYHASDIADDAAVIIADVIIVKGAGGREYEIPEVAHSRYIEVRPFPQRPYARIAVPVEPSEGFERSPVPVVDHENYIGAEQGDNDAQLLGGVPVEGDPAAIAFIRTVARLYHEMPGIIFPLDGELRWFKTGIHVVASDEKHAFQVPMDRVADMIVPREYPLLPIIRMTISAKRAQK